MAVLAFLLLLALLPGSALQPLEDGRGAPGPADEEGIILSAPPAYPVPATPAGRLADRALLLCWHTFLGDPGLVTDFSLKELAAQLDALAALGYRFVDLADALAGRFEGRLNVVVTIDDGHRSVPDAVRKVFLPRGVRPALFVYPAVIGNVPQAMDEASLKELSSLGCLVGAHGYHHLFVNEALYKSQPGEFMKEIYKAKSRTEAIAGLPVMGYAYPFGAYSEVTLSEVEKAGYDFGIGVRSGFIYASGFRNEAFLLPRLVVRRDNWAEILGLLERNARSGG